MTDTTVISPDDVVVIQEIDDIATIATGDQGPPGPRGNAVLSGAAMPAVAVGITGDFYLNTTSYVMYGPKVAGSWPSLGTALIGPIGPNGPQGVPGPPGVPGVKSWLTPVAWVTGTAYVAGPPASCVTELGSCYVCLVSHTAGVFNTDLTAGKWALLAQGSTAALSDAPSDGTTYGRQSAAWVHVLPLAGGTMTGPIVLAADPTTSSQAATKNYVDTHALGGDAPSDSHAYARKNAAWSRGVDLAGDTMTGLLLLSADPTAALGAATKQYADKMLPLAGGTMTGAITLPADPTTNLQAATKQYVDAHVTGGGGLADAPSDGTYYGRYNGAWSHVLALAGGTLTGALVLQADPGTPLGAATKQYVDAHGFADAPADGSNYGRNNNAWAKSVPLAGGTMTGALALAADPTAAPQAATKNYVDNQVAAVAGGIPSGTVMLFYQASAPIGWTALTTQNDKLLRVVNPANNSAGTAGGSTAFSTYNAVTATGAHTLTSGELPVFSTYGANSIVLYPAGNTGEYFPVAAGAWGFSGVGSGPYTAYSYTNSSASYSNYTQANVGLTTSTSGGYTGGQSHFHPITRNIAYCDVLICSKN